MDKATFYYSLYCIVLMVFAGIILYQAWFNHNRTCIIAVCIVAAIEFGNMVYRNDQSVMRGFLTGLFGEQQNDNDR